MRATETRSWYPSADLTDAERARRGRMLLSLARLALERELADGPRPTSSSAPHELVVGEPRAGGQKAAVLAASLRDEVQALVSRARAELSR